MLILGLLCMFFDAAVVFVTSQTFLFRLALAILCFRIERMIIATATIVPACIYLCFKLPKTNAPWILIAMELGVLE